MTESGPDCRCEKPNRPTGREAERLPPWRCLTCGGYACEYADPGQTRCSPSICDCFIATYPDSPRDLHPEAFVVGEPWVTVDVGYVHVLTEPGGPCVDTCPHPDHSTPLKEST